MGLFGILWKVIALAVLAVIGLGAYLYFTDYEVSATVTERGQEGGQYFVLIEPEVLPSYTYKAFLDQETWQFVCEGYVVKFHVKSQEYRVYDAKGNVIYNSATGERDTQAAVACGVSNTPGGGGILGVS